MDLHCALLCQTFCFQIHDEATGAPLTIPIVQRNLIRNSSEELQGMQTLPGDVAFRIAG